MEQVRAFLKDVLGWFLSGLVILLPLAATMILIGWALNFLDGLIGGQSVFARIWQWFFSWTQLGEPLSLFIGYFLLFLIIVAVGYFARGFAQQQFANFLRNFFSRIPLVNKIYSSVEQVIDLWSKKKEGEEQLTHVGDIVMVDFANAKALGILSSRETYRMQGEDYYLVYLPSSPVPATGLNYFFKVQDVSFTTLKMDDMTKIIVSLGVLGKEVLDGEIPLKPMQGK